MSLSDQLTADVKEAMKSGDTLTRDTIRLILAAIQAKKQEKKDLAIKKGLAIFDLTEEEIIGVVQTFKKNLEEEMEGQAQRGNAERVQYLDNTRAVTVRYLPKQLSKGEIIDVVAAAIAYGAKNKGEIMKAVMPQLRGKADNKLISEVVDEMS